MRERKRHRIKGVYPRKDGRYEWQIVEGKDPMTGNPKRLARGICKTEKEAEDARTKALVKLHLGVSPQQEKQTVGEFLDYWLAEHVKGSKAPKTERFYEQMVRLYIKPSIGHLQLGKLNSQHCQRLINDLAREARSIKRKDAEGKEVSIQLAPLTPRSIQAVRATLRAALNSAVKTHKLIPSNPMLGVTAPKIERIEYEYLFSDEASKLIKAAKAHYLSNLIEFAIHTGLRLGEATGLTWADVDLGSKSIHVRRQLQRVDSKLTLRTLKTSSSRRTITLTTDAATALEDQAKKQAIWRESCQTELFNELDLVFTLPEGRPLDPKLVDKNLKALVRIANITKPLSFHNLRHTAATHLTSAGVPLNVVKEILGHSQIALTANTYAHAVPAAHQAAFELLQRTYTSGVSRKELGEGAK